MNECSSAPAPSDLLSVKGLRVDFPVRTPHSWFARPGKFAAVDGVDLRVAPGETLAIVGESGCGKSTLAKTLVGLQSPTSGKVEWQSQVLFRAGRAVSAWPRRDIQMIFQDPFASLDPRMTVYRLIAQPLYLYEPRLTPEQMHWRVHAMMDRVGLASHTAHRYPHEFSGGQCQRIGIARALIGSPRLLICDEPVSALDVSIRAQVINLLMDLQKAEGLALIFIAHDLAVVRHIATRVMVMYRGRTVEEGATARIFGDPRHPYTQMLLSAVPVADPTIARQRQFVSVIKAQPTPLAMPTGCTFQGRCLHAQSECATLTPTWKTLHPDHMARCHGVHEEAAFGVNEDEAFGANEKEAFGANGKQAFGANEKQAFGANEKEAFANQGL